MSGSGFVGAAAALPVTGVAISTLGDPFGSETVCASDPVAARLDEIQLDLGEGPCWEAMTTGQPVLQPDVQTATSDRWPFALSAMRDTRLGAAFAFPMRFGGIDIGAVDLYNNAPSVLTPEAVQQALVLAEAAARQVLRRTLARTDGDPNTDSAHDIGEYSRREVYQASGMLAAQTGTNSTDALLLLRGHAFTADRSVMDLAADVIARTVNFTDHRSTGHNDSAS